MDGMRGRRGRFNTVRNARKAATQKIRLGLIRIYEIYMIRIIPASSTAMGIVNIDDDLHDQIRRACTVSHRSINAQANFWIKVGMLCEMNPELSFQEIVAGELRAAGVKPHPLRSKKT